MIRLRALRRAGLLALAVVAFSGVAGAEFVRPGLPVACKAHAVLSKIRSLEHRHRGEARDRLLHAKLRSGQCVQLIPGDEVRVLGQDWLRGLLHVRRVGDAGAWWMTMLSVWKEEDIAVRAPRAKARR